MFKKGYKVTDSDRQKKIGIAADSLEDLKQKTLKKINTWVKDEDQSTKDIYFQLIDGTRVDTEEYFQTIPSQTTLIWVEEGKIASTDAERLYAIIRDVNLEYLNTGAKVQDFVLTELKAKVFQLNHTLNTADDCKTTLSTKNEHPEWFEGLDTRSKTKEEYLFRRSQDRIRNYYYKTKDSLKTNNHKRIIELLAYLLKELKKVNYFGCYFDRSYFVVDSVETDMRCLCDRKGTFACEGRWNESCCQYEPKHIINPYASRESRILFQTWNLDHRVERSRFILPELNKIKDVNFDFQRVFNDLFTMQNLKLVHIVCHDKTKHTLAISDYTIKRE